MNAGNRPARVRVTGPPRRAVVRRERAREITEDTALGSVLMSSLLTSQLQLALRVIVPLLLLAFGLPLLFALVPSLTSVTALGVPISWIILAAGVYPLLVLLGWYFVRRAEAHEDDFIELLQTADEPAADQPGDDRPGDERPGDDR